MSPFATENFGVEMNRISKGTDLSERMAKRHKGTKAAVKRKARVGAFTLIELLAVISIIAVLAGLVLSTAGLATRKSRESRMRNEHERLRTSIEVYKTDLGNFPPDNPALATLSDKDPNYQDTRHIKAGFNSLYYELSGCTFTNASGGSFVPQNRTDSTKAADLRAAFGVKGVENSARNKRDIPLRTLITFKSNQHENIDGYDNVDILVAPLPGPYDSKFVAKGGKKFLNPWFYDASSTNRHNIETFDLWTEYKSGKETNIIGNW